MLGWAHVWERRVQCVSVYWRIESVVGYSVCVCVCVCYRVEYVCGRMRECSLCWCRQEWGRLECAFTPITHNIPHTVVVDNYTTMYQMSTHS